MWIYNALSRFSALLKAYPALSAALVNIAILVCAHFGFAVTGTQLVYVAGVAIALLGVLVHSQVTPVSKLPASAPSSVVVIQPDEKK